MEYANTPQPLDSATQDYINAVNAYRAQKEAQGYLVKEAERTNFDGSAQSLAQAAAAGVPIENLFNLGRAFKTNAGKKAKTKANPDAVVWARPDEQYRITNERGKNEVLYSGSGPQALDTVYQLASELSQTQGKGADWKMERYDPVADKWVVWADDDPPGSDLGGLGKVLSIAAPILGAIALPGLGLVGGALGAGLGAAGGSALSGVVQGKGIESILKNAALSGGLSYLGASALGAGGGASGGVSSGGSGALGAGAGSAGSVGLNAAGEIVVQGAKGGLGALGAGLAGGAGALANGVINGMSAGSGNYGGFDPGGEIVVEGRVQDAANAIRNGATAAEVARMGLSVAEMDAAYQAAGQGDPQYGDIVVEGSKPQPLDLGGPIDFGAIAGLGGLAGLGAGALGGDTPPNEKSTIDKVIDGLRAAGLITGFVGNAFGGGGGGSGATVPGGLNGDLNPIFSADLPTGGLAALDFAPRQMPEQDWNTYAMRPEQSFFKNVPQGGQ